MRDWNYKPCTVWFSIGQLTVWSRPELESLVGNSEPERMYCTAHSFSLCFFLSIQGTWKRLSLYFELTHALFVFDMELSRALGFMTELKALILLWYFCFCFLPLSRTVIGNFEMMRKGCFFNVFFCRRCWQNQLSLAPLVFVSPLCGKLCSWPLHGPQHLPVWTRLGRVELF